MSLRGGFGPAVAAPSVLSVSLPSLNFVCSYLLSFCLGPRDVAWGPQTKTGQKALDRVPTKSSAAGLSANRAKIT